MADDYLDVADVADSYSMRRRVAASAAAEGVPAAKTWAADNDLYWAAAPGWGAAWASSMAAHPDDPTWDPGAQRDVITDGMILAQVQAMLAAGP